MSCYTGYTYLRLLGFTDTIPIMQNIFLSFEVYRHHHQNARLIYAFGVYRHYTHFLENFTSRVLNTTDGPP